MSDTRRRFYEWTGKTGQRQPVFKVWLDPKNQNMAKLGKVIKNETITELASFIVPKQANGSLPVKAAADEAVEEPRQSMFDWPDFNRSSTRNE